MAVQPLRPDQVQEAKNLSVPDEVLNVFNALISENWNGSSSRVLQTHVASRISAALGISRQAVFDLKYLDVEDIYRGQGWVVEYDKPGYCESYEAHFTFTRP